MKVAIGRSSRIPSDARNIVLKSDGIGRSTGCAPLRNRPSHASACTPDSPNPDATISLNTDLSMAPRRKSRSGRVYCDPVDGRVPDPMVDESDEPIAGGQIMHGTVGDVLVALFRPR